MFLASELIKNLHAATFASMLRKSGGFLHEAVRSPFSICKHIHILRLKKDFFPSILNLSKKYTMLIYSACFVLVSLTSLSTYWSHLFLMIPLVSLFMAYRKNGSQDPMRTHGILGGPRTLWGSRTVWGPRTLGGPRTFGGPRTQRGLRTLWSHEDPGPYEDL